MACDKEPVQALDAESANRELQTLRTRYAIPENQRLCVGYNGGCDGDLEGTAHEPTCPAFARDRELRPHLYEPSYSVVRENTDPR